MKNCLLPILMLYLYSFSSTAQSDLLQKDELTTGNFEPKFVLATIEKVAVWQMREFDKDRNRWPKWDWTNGALYTGLMEAGKISNDERYFKFLINTGREMNWDTGPRRFFGDDYCVAQLYCQLYRIFKQPEMIQRFILQADSIVALPHNESLLWVNDIQLREWAWCDALYMAPPALAYLTTATGNMKYLETADRLWWKTAGYLFDTTEHLFFRDSKYFASKEANGQKMFWARGNGWVLGGLVRMLENMPADFPGRKRYEDLFRKMVKKIASVQHPDGTWHTALLDQESYLSKETSGTGFYLYAFSWGIRHGLISYDEYFPVITRAWNALVSSVHPDGKLGYVQKIGEKPGAVDYNSTEVYGVGAFLLAGTELYQLMMEKKSVEVNNLSVKNEHWNFVGAGGGGAMFYPSISPHNKNVAFVSCDMTGSFVTLDGGESWRMFNLRGPVQYYVFDPLDSNTVYAKSIGLFKSTDRGSTWNLIYPHPSEIKAVVSKGDHATERIVPNDNSLQDVLAFAIDPANSSRLFAVISINKSVGFYSSVDGGYKWIKEKVLHNRPQKIYIDPASPINNRSIYIAGSKSILQKIQAVWKSYPTPKGVKGISEFSGGYDGQLKKTIIYAISGKSYFNTKGDQSGIYYTDDGGRSWQNRQGGMLRFNVDTSAIPEWRTIATSALHPEVVYVSYAGLKIHKDTTCIGVAKSNDYGKSWDLVWQDRLTKAGGIQSANFSKDWLNDRYGPGWGENPFSIGVSPTDPSTCLGTDFGRTIKTTDAGKSWEQVYSIQKLNAGWISRGLQVTTPYDVVSDPFDQSHVFIANSDIGLQESKDAAVSWLSITEESGIPERWVNSCYSLVFDPSVKGRAWAAMSAVHDLPRPKMFKKGTAGYIGGIVQTDDACKTWKAVSATIGEAAITHLLVDPASPNAARILYACAFGKGVYKSTDGGKTWKQKNKGIEGNEPFAWKITRREKDSALFLIISRRSEDGSYGNKYDGAMYRSSDGAESWIRIRLPKGTNGPTSLMTDQQHPGKLLLSAWGRFSNKRFTPDSGGGIFLSEDEGSTWQNVLAKDQHIHDLSVDIRNRRLYACGFNGSAYYSVNGGNNWIRIKGFNFKWGRKVIPDPVDTEKIFITTFGGGVWHGPATGDLNASEDIVTPMFTR